MADQDWMDALNHDPDLTPDGDEVDALIKSAKEELERSEAMLDAEPELEPEEPREPEPEQKPAFQPHIPDVYADLTLEEEDDAPEPRQRRRLSAGWRVLIYVVSVLAASVLLALIGWQCADDVLALTKPDREVTITVAEDDTVDDVTETLAAHGMIEYQWLFKFYCWFSHAEDKIEPGTYELNNVYDYHALVSGMTGMTNRVARSVTIPEGFDCDQIFELLEEKGVCKAEELYEAAANGTFDYSFLTELQPGERNRLEGYLFPDTYEFYSVKSEEDDEDPNWSWPEGAVGDDPERVLGKFLDNFERKFDDEMRLAIDDLNTELRERMAAAGFTEEEIEAAMMDTDKIIIVASLIEKETASAAESATISSVIYNRLCSKVYPLLQIDATVLYALGEHKTELTAADLMVDSPYNTRKYPGLPIGPIANPGLDSIEAALHPEETNYYFYALDTDGMHHFSETYQEHEDFLEQLEAGGNE